MTLILQSHAEQESLAKSIKSTYASLNVSLPQPFITCCGPINNIGCVHVTIDEFTYNFTDIFSAVDFLFKSFFIFDLPYPLGCSHVWTFIQRQLYELEKGRNCIAKREAEVLFTDINRLEESKKRKTN